MVGFLHQKAISREEELRWRVAVQKRADRSGLRRRVPVPADVLGVRRHFLGIALLSGCAATAADVNDDLTVDTVDVLAIRRFYLGLNTGTANVGKWRFNPSSRSYDSLAASQSGQNYDALVIGDISGDLTPTRVYPEGNSPVASANVPGPSSNSNAPSAVATVSLPIANISTSVTNFTLPVSTSNIDSTDNLQAFQGEFARGDRLRFVFPIEVERDQGRLDQFRRGLEQQHALCR